MSIVLVSNRVPCPPYSVEIVIYTLDYSLSVLFEVRGDRELTLTVAEEGQYVLVGVGATLVTAEESMDGEKSRRGLGMVVW